MIVGQYDSAADIAASSLRTAQAFISSDPGCNIIFEMSYLDINNNRVIFPT
jgi:hypothetical protein